MREPDNLGGVGTSYLLSALALPNSLYLPLISRNDPVEPAKAVFETEDKGQESGDRRQGSGVRSGSGPVAPGLIPDMTRAVSHAAGGDPANLIIAGEGGTIYVASSEHHAVLALDAATRAERAIAPDFRQPGGLALLRDATLGDRLFVADTLAGTVRVLDAGDLRLLSETTVGSGPYALAAAPQAGHIFAALTGGDEVAMLDASGTLLATTHLGGLGFPQGIAVDATDGRVYVSYALSPRYGQIAVLDGVTGAVVRLIPPTLNRPLAGASRLAITRTSGDPPERHLRIDSTAGTLTYNLESDEWIDARSIASQ